MIALRNAVGDYLKAAVRNLILVVGLVLFGAVGTLRADDFTLPSPDGDDPATFQVCASATSCPGNDPNIVNGSSFYITLNGGSKNPPALNNPWYLILGTVNGVNPGTNLAINGYNVQNMGLAATMTSTSASAYGLLKQSSVDTYLASLGANSSQNWTNWSGFDSSFHPTSFGLYVYSITPASSSTPTFGGGDVLNVTSSGLPAGTIIFGYGIGSNGKAYSTPFTQAGGTSGTPPAVPEPASLVLMGTGLVGLAGLLRRRYAAV